MKKNLWFQLVVKSKVLLILFLLPILVLEEKSKFQLGVNERQNIFFFPISTLGSPLWICLRVGVLSTSLYSSHTPLLPRQLTFRWFLQMVINNCYTLGKLLMLLPPTHFSWFYFFLLLYPLLSAILTTLFSILFESIEVFIKWYHVS